MSLDLKNRNDFTKPFEGESALEFREIGSEIYEFLLPYRHRRPALGKALEGFVGGVAE